MDERRTARVSEAIREELLELIGFEMQDPRVKSISITGVEMSADSRNCVVRVSSPDGNAALAALNHAAGFLRHELAVRLDLRRMPELRFEIDKHPDADQRIELLLKRAEKTRAR